MEVAASLLHHTCVIVHLPGEYDHPGKLVKGAPAKTKQYSDKTKWFSNADRIASKGLLFTRQLVPELWIKPIYNSYAEMLWNAVLENNHNLTMHKYQIYCSLVQLT